MMPECTCLMTKLCASVGSCPCKPVMMGIARELSLRGDSKQVVLAADAPVDDSQAYWAVELDLEPFKAHFPMMSRPSSIGDGVRFLNRHAPSYHCKRFDSFPSIFTSYQALFKCPPC